MRQFHKYTKFIATLFFVFFASCSLNQKHDSFNQRGPSSIDGFNDVSYRFESQKVSEIKNSFKFFRSFVDYFYLVYAHNRQQLKITQSLENQTGWCVGDAHAENFGVLLQQNYQNVFTINDMDDAGPCPVILDLLRLSTGSILYSDKIDITKVITAYMSGLNAIVSKDVISNPKYIDSLLKKSLKNGYAAKENRYDENDHLIPDDQSESVPADQKNIIENLVEKKWPIYNLVDLLRTEKTTGGSSGLTRYEILLKRKKDLGLNAKQKDSYPKYLILELKQLTLPAIHPVAKSIPLPSDRIKQTILFEQGKSPSEFYQTIQVFDQSWLLRPKFSGNIGVDLNDESKEDNLNLIIFEAYTLGKIHAQSLPDTKSFLKQLSAIDKKAFADEAKAFAIFMKMKFKSLQNN